MLDHGANGAEMAKKSEQSNEFQNLLKFPLQEELEKALWPKLDS